ncbi:MAG TPA: response regulator, partial [Acidimicrobiales bacterium]|nr:response regulator [Acidimicrobiales bacterium]
KWGGSAVAVKGRCRAGAASASDGGSNSHPRPRETTPGHRGDRAGAADETGRTEDAGGPEQVGLRPDVRAFVLVVDDEPDVRDSIAAILQGNGFAVASAVDGREAMLVLEELVVDVMVLDVRMPRLGGLALLELLDHPPATVVVSADPVDAATRARLGAKVHRYLAKPFDPRRLVEAVTAASGSR